MSDVRETWAALLDAPPDKPGLMFLRLRPDSARDVLLAVNRPSGNRMLVIRVADEALFGTELKGTGAVRTSVLGIGKGRSELRVELVRPEVVDVFTAFVEDVTDHIADSPDDRAAVTSLRDRFARWVQLFAGELGHGLSRNEALGLWGELWVLRTFLFPCWKQRTADSWTGADADEKDFRLGVTCVEVKTTAAGRPQAVRVNGERQLEIPEGARLLLAVVEVDAHEGGTGETLIEAVAAARALFQGPAALSFEQRLASRAYSDDNDLYRTTRYVARSTTWHEVVPNFPRIVTSQLADGVGDVNYRLAVDACIPFRVAPGDSLTAVLAEGILP